MLSLSSAAIKKELEKDEISKEAILDRIKYIDTSIKQIDEVLNKLNSISDPILSDYDKNIKMIKVDEEGN